MKNIKLNGVAFKLGAILVIFVMVLIICIEIILYSLFIRFYTDDVIHDQITRSQSYASVLSDHYNSSTIQHIIRMENETDNLLLIMDGTSKIVGQSQSIDHLNPSYLNEIISHETDSHGPVLASDWKHEPYFITRAPIFTDGAANGQIIMFGPTEPIQTAVKTLRTTFNGVAIIIILLGAAVILFVSGKIVNPLLNMIQMTHRISEGKHDIKLDTHGSDEITQLAKAINRMSTSIQYYKKQRNQFLSDISHELRTPLTYMKGYSEVMLNDIAADEDERQQYLKLIHTQSVQLQRLVQDLFDLANLDQQTFSLTFQRTSVDKVIINALSLMEVPIKQKKIDLLYTPSSKPLFVRGDERRLQQVIVNLLENGKKYTPEGGTITISIQNDGDFGLIEIADTGSGIPEEELPLIWERLYRVDKSRSRTSGGAGLGLAICKEIIELHHGQIHVKSSIGQGTSFLISLPLVNEAT
ncbi:sensor histidine kinase [Paenibacillus sp. sgz302251]|uniref:sensor histidine kinase n=1 Tax=Paenibacillus sp. sgz302251 TaxID=3414493 RepID=UPI003C7C251C